MAKAFDDIQTEFTVPNDNVIGITAPPDLFTDLIEGDCIDRLKEVEDHSVQLAILDLPYSVTHLDWDSLIDLPSLWAELKRVMIPDRGAVLAHGTQPFTSKVVASNLDWFKYGMVWQKTRATNFQHSNQRPMNDHEDLMVFSSGVVVAKSQSTRQMVYNPQGLIPCERKFRRKPEQRIGFLGRTVFRGGTTEQKWTNYPRTVLPFASVRKPVHSTQKPVPLLRYLIRTYSNPGDIVLDPTAGSGSTGEAALLEGRSFIGIERDRVWYDVMSRRLSDDHEGWEDYARRRKRASGRVI